MNGTAKSMALNITVTSDTSLNTSRAGIAKVQGSNLGAVKVFGGKI